MGGAVTAPGGRVELAGVATSGTIGLNNDTNNWRLTFPNGVGRADILLANNSHVNVRGNGGGSIAITADNLRMSLGSQLIAGISSNVFSPSSQPGNIEINVTNLVNLSDGILISNQALKGARGDSGNINITAGSLLATNLTSLDTRNLGDGNAGNVNIAAADTVSFDQSSILNSVEQRSLISPTINITAKTLSLSNNSAIDTRTQGHGNAGTVTINASDIFNIDRSKIYINVEKQLLTVGNGGNLSINTNQLNITNGGQIIANTTGIGNAGLVNINAGVVDISGSDPLNKKSSGILTSTAADGKAENIIINTGRFRIANGAVLSASSTGNKQGGNITINATGTIEAVNDGQLLTTTTGSGGGGNITLKAEDISLANDTQLSASAAGTGKAGNVSVQANHNLSLTNGAQITASSSGISNAGDILNITANSLNIDNSSIITSSTSGNGGNIANIQVQDLRLRNNSQISTSAGTDNNGGGNGGNINFNIGTLVVIENSSIKAQAYAGTGGNIQIVTQGYFLTPDSVISASSQKGINGVVNVQNLGFGVTNSFTISRGNFFNGTQTIANSCLISRNRQRGKFTVTGLDTLPITPYTNFDLWYALPRGGVAEGGSNQSPVTRQLQPITISKWKIGDPIVEAQAIVRTADGRTLLSSVSEKAQPESVNSLICHPSEENSKS